MTARYANPTILPPRALDSVPATDTPPFVPDKPLNEISNNNVTIHNVICPHYTTF